MKKDKMVIDTHVHYYNPQSKKCWIADRIQEFTENNIRFVEISINCFDTNDMMTIMNRYDPCLVVVIGEHPKLVTADTDIQKIFRYIKDHLTNNGTKVLGIKTGLDYHWGEDRAARQKQQELLRMFLEYAKEENFQSFYM